MPSQQRRRPTGRRRRSSVAARRRARPVYMRLGFWLTACALVIVVVLLTKGFDRGRIETGGPADLQGSVPTGGQPGDSVGNSNNETAGAARPTQPATGVMTPPTQPTQSVSSGSQTAAGPTEKATAAGTTAQTPTQPSVYETHELTAGNYLIGTDIPAGTADIVAAAGSGSIAASDGAVALAAFGGAYDCEKDGVALKAGVSLTISGNLKVRLSYTTTPQLDGAGGGGQGPVYTFAGGAGSSFIVGEDLLPGTYNIAVLAGYGEVVTSDAASGTGISGMMGLADGGGNYQQSAAGIVLNEGVTMTVRNCTITLTKID